MERYNCNLNSDTMLIYHKHGKIHWAKHSRFSPYEVFHGNTVHWPAVVFII